MPPQSDPRARYRKLETWKSPLDKKAASRARKFLRTVKRGLKGELLTVAPWNANVMKTAISRLLRFYDRQFEIISEGMIIDSADRGANTMSKMLINDLGPTGDIRKGAIQVAVPIISRVVFEQQMMQRGDLIKDVLQDQRKAIMHQVNLAGVGVQDQEIATRNIMQILGNEQDGRIFNRAKRILHQESIVANNTATQIVQQQTEEITGVKLKKVWMASPDRRVRPTHREAERKYAEGARPGPIPIKQKFKVGAASLRYPGDPLSSHLEETMNCRCQSVPLKIDINKIKPSGKPQIIRR